MSKQPSNNLSFDSQPYQTTILIMRTRPIHFTQTAVTIIITVTTILHTIVILFISNETEHIPNLPDRHVLSLQVNTDLSSFASFSPSLLSKACLYDHLSSFTHQVVITAFKSTINTSNYTYYDRYTS